MNLNQFTIKSQEVIQQAQQLAMSMENQAIETGHLMKGILISDQHVTPYILKKLNVNAQRIEQTLESILTSYPKISGGELYFSKKSNEVIQKAILALKEFKDDIIELIIDEAASILAGDIESGNQFSRGTEGAERNN